MGNLKVRVDEYIKNKKKSCKTRGIGWNLTKEDVEYLASFDKCAYTGVKMSNASELQSEDSFSLDRIDPYDSYRIGNVVPCTVLANSLKEKYFEDKNKCPEGISQFQVKYVEGIASFLRSSNYLKYVPDDKKGNIVPPKLSNLININPIRLVKHIDKEIANKYLSLAGDKDDFMVSLPCFRKLLLRKTCSLTGVKLGSMSDRKVIRFNNSLGWVDGNVFVTNNAIARIYKNIFINSGLTNKQVVKLIKNSIDKSNL